MRTKFLILTLSALTTVFFIVIFIYFQDTKNLKSKLTIQRTGEKEIFVGDKQMVNDAPGDFTAQYQREIRAIDEAHQHIQSGDFYSRQDRFDKAAEEYEKAYLIGEKAVSGLLLAQTYGKLGRYDDGVKLLNNMIQKHQLSEHGVQNAKELKSKFFAAKNQSQPSGSL